MIPMKAGIEAGHLRHARQSLFDGFDGRQIVWLVQRRERNQFLQLSHNLWRDHHRLGELRAAMDHAMAHAEHSRALVMRSKPECEGTDRVASVLDSGGV